MFNTLKRAQKANNFKVSVKDSDWSDKWDKLISAQTVAVDVNLVRKQATLHVRQLQAGYIQDLIFHVLQDEHRKIDEVRISPAKGSAYEMVFTNGTLVDHETSFDYYDNGELIHVLVLVFDQVDLHSYKAHAPKQTIRAKG